MRCTNRSAAARFVLKPKTSSVVFPLSTIGRDRCSVDFREDAKILAETEWFAHLTKSAIGEDATSLAYSERTMRNGEPRWAHERR
jgi:hypothetical protein